MLRLPDIYNLENQTPTLGVYDNQTNKTYPFITVSEPDILVLTFEPTNDVYVGDHLIKLVLSDNLLASTAYLLKMKILPLINKGAPIFSQLPDKWSFRVALGEKFSHKFDYPISDRDPEDTDILQSFKGPAALSRYLTYEANTKTLECTIPLIKPPSITLDYAYPLRFTLNDKNLAGPREKTYTFYLEVYDPSSALSKYIL